MMEFPTEIGHIEEIEEQIDDDTDTIVVSANTSRGISSGQQKVVLIQTPQGIRRTVRVQTPQSIGTSAGSGGVQYVKTDAGIIQVRTGSTPVVQRPSSTNVVVRSSPANKTFIGNKTPGAQKPQQAVTKTITLTEAQQLGILQPAGSSGKLITLNPTIKHEGGPVRLLNSSQAPKALKSAEDTPKLIEVAPSGTTPLINRLVKVGHASIKLEPESAVVPGKRLSDQTKERLEQIEGAVVMPGHSQKVVMLPSDYIDQLTKSDPDGAQLLHEEEAITELDETDIIVQSNSPTPNDITEVTKKRPCNCTRSQCLKLYCECFANGELCSNCNCKDCSNTLEHEDLRQEAIYQCLARNPNAFRPKIGKVNSANVGLRHHKGCHCKRSGCLKNYCECFEAKIPCSDMCKCVDCKNSDENCSNVNSALLGTGKSGSAIKRAAAAVDGMLRIKGGEDDEPPPKQPYNFMTADVVDATVQCMMAQADECQQNGVSYRNTERLILEEFGRCLAEIIDFSTKNTE